ncbi:MULTISPECIES: phage holin family protein [unclassified Serratia (in: enterobacteria)]|uniref:phage holin family protein n=1 Tax=unclassified Serratia (in: enterobacteria) TaxID=2647522 RepID=UPI00068CE3D8|nr:MULTISPECIES: phage holin family protein [unclassified Serratia (in: enterobacteria)]
MSLDTLLLAINGIACGLIALRLLAFRRGKKNHDYCAAFFAFVIIAASGTVAIRLALGVYDEVDPAEALLNVALCIGVFAVRGNIKLLVRFSGVKKSEVSHE